MPKFSYASTVAKPKKVIPKVVGQTVKAKRTQVLGNGNGYVFKLNPIKQLERFLILGSDQPTFYQTAQALTRQNAKVVEACWQKLPKETMFTIRDVTVENRAPRKSPAIFAMALGTLSENVEARQLVYANLGSIARTASQLFEFLSYCETLGKGWGRGMKNAVAKFYQRADIGYQMIKYRQRNGFTHQRAISLSHPKIQNQALAKFALGQELTLKDYTQLPEAVVGFVAVQRNYKKLVDFPHLPWEALPTEALNDPWVWQQLLPNMPVIAMVRNLGKMTSLGIIKPLSDEENIIVQKLKEPKGLHPVNILIAKKTYESGHGLKGSLTWRPNATIVGALERAFYAAFQYLEPTGKRIMIGLDVSGSMNQNKVMGMVNFTAREASAALAMSIIRQEDRVYMHGFSTDFVDLQVTREDSLSQVMTKVSNLPFARTNCAVPMIHAKQHGLQVDTFVIFTDNETNYGSVHPYQALKDYRAASGIDAGLVVAAMTPTPFIIADPADHKSLDVVGMDASLPALIAQY